MTVIKHQGNAGFFSTPRNENLNLLNTDLDSVISLSLWDKYMIESVLFSAHNAIGPMAANDHAYVAIVVPEGKVGVLFASVDMALSGTVAMYKNSDVSGGTPIDVIEHNQVTPIPADLVLTEGITVVDVGTQIGAWAVASAAKANKASTNLPYGGVFVLASGTFLIDFESLVADNALEYNFQWGEPNAGSLISGEAAML